MSAKRWVMLSLAVAATGALGAASRIPVTIGRPELSHVRLSWRLAGEIVEVCRERSQEELERLPVHMRIAEACEGRGTPWLLVVRVDDTERVRRVVEPRGARGDRPVAVIEELSTDAGAHRVEVRFGPMDPAAQSESLLYDEVLDLQSGEVALISLDPDARRLVRLEP